MSANGKSDSSRQSRKFLWGWGGVLAVLLGIGVPLALSPVIDWFVSLMERTMVFAGMTRDTAVLTIYWMQFIGIGIGFAIVFLGTNIRIATLRRGLGGWSILLREAAIIACAVTLWLIADSAWEAYVDIFNTYGV